MANTQDDEQTCSDESTKKPTDFFWKDTFVKEQPIGPSITLKN